jgi:hypothetical protein
MHRALWLVIAVAVASAGCGDNLEPPGLSPDDLLARLRALPGVTVHEAATNLVDARYYVMHFTQPVDHNDPSRGTFQQEVSLLHRSELQRVPMIIHTSGYADTTRDREVELTKLLFANQVSIEHRYFGESRPRPTDWSKLTIAQAAADEHDIITALRTIYAGAFITTGTSKGGMTAVFHRRFYGDEVDGTVAYVAPISFGTPDTRYASFMEQLGDVGPRACWQAVRDVATELLQNRRSAMCSFAEDQGDHVYTRVEIGPAVEAAIVSLEWTFWQYSGEKACDSVPPRTADDWTLFAFLDKVSPVSDNDDAKIASFEAYYYQSYAELGYPDNGAGGYLSAFMWFDESAYEHELPAPEPMYDSNAMRDILDYVNLSGNRLLFVYGQWDPWTGGKIARGNAVDSAVLTVPHGNHWAKLANLELSDREEAFTKLKNWTGVTPTLARLRRADSADPAQRVPTALVHATVEPK